jgi:hypothetical protein
VTDTIETDEPCLEFAFDYDAGREKVWKAISTHELREKWLPDQKVLAVLEERAMEQLDLLMEETDRPFQRSVVSFALRDGRSGGTVLTIRHSISQARAAANSNTIMMRAA